MSAEYATVHSKTRPRIARRAVPSHQLQRNENIPRRKRAHNTANNDAGILRIAWQMSRSALLLHSKFVYCEFAKSAALFAGTLCAIARRRYVEGAINK